MHAHQHAPTHTHMHEHTPTPHPTHPHKTCVCWGRWGGGGCIPGEGYLHVRWVIVNDSGLCCCVCVMFVLCLCDVLKALLNSLFYIEVDNPVSFVLFQNATTPFQTYHHKHTAELSHNLLHTAKANKHQSNWLITPKNAYLIYYIYMYWYWCITDVSSLLENITQETG